MGMYDTLYINKNKLPLTEEEKNLINDDQEWQTKDLDCVLTEVYITDDGELKINNFEYEMVPEEQRPHPNAEGLLGLAGSIRRINERLETLNLTGMIKFYGTIKDKWYLFYARFENGKLQQIVGGLDYI